MRTILLLAFGVALAGPTPTLEQSVALPVLATPRISPDGKQVAYVVQDADWKANEFKSNIWMVSASTGERWPITTTGKTNSAPEWSPNGKRLAFLSDRGGKPQIYLIPTEGGEPVALTRTETGVNDFHWSPDGKVIVFSSPDEQAKSAKERKERFGDFEVVDQDHSMVHLWSIAPEEPDAKPKRLTEGRDFSATSFCWSPDSEMVAFAATRDPSLSAGVTSDIFVVRINERTAVKLVQTKGPDTSPVWSPFGRLMAYLTANGDETGFFYKTPRIAVSSTVSFTPLVLTEHFDETPRLLAWGPAGIYFDAPIGMSAHLFVLDPNTRTHKRLSQPQDLILQSPSFTADFETTAFLCSSPNKVTEVCVSPLQSFTPRPLTNYAKLFDPFLIARREIVEWKSKDGTRIEGVLIKPPGFDPEKKYPLLVVIHGGPRGVDRPDVRPDRFYPVEQFAARGAVVLRPNYRGSEGYGERFRSLNVRNLGLGDYDDVISGVDMLIAKGFVDRTRVGAMGWSQGGYISAFITTFSDRFRAVSVGAGISDWLTYYANTDIQPFTRQYLRATPWDDPEIYRRTSPITYINKAKTPTLIQHGDQDKRVPVPNAYELYRGLQDRGVPSRLIVFKGFGHGINKPKEHLAVLTQNYEWFVEWIWGEKPGANSAAAAPKSLE